MTDLPIWTGPIEEYDKRQLDRMKRHVCNSCLKTCVPFDEVYHLCHICWLERQNCLDCGWNTRALNEYYRVHDELWQRVVPDKCGMLCIGCLEKRVGRPLTREDFSLETPINQDSYKWPKSIRFRKILGYPIDN